MYWASCGVDPDEVDPEDDLTPMQSVFLKLAMGKLAGESPDDIAYRADYNKKMSAAQRGSTAVSQKAPGS